MGRCSRQQQHRQKNQEDLWEDALETIFEFEKETVPSLSKSLQSSSKRSTKHKYKLQIVGVHSCTCTAFARFVASSHTTSVDNVCLSELSNFCSLSNIVDKVMREIQAVTTTSENAVKGHHLSWNAKELLRLGSVWLLVYEKDDKEQLSLSETRRATHNDDGYSVLDWSCVTLRIHFKPNRYPAVYQVDWGSYLQSCSTINTDVTLLPRAIIAADFEIGYIIVDKPGSVPSHATVDNNIENVLTMLRNALKLQFKSNDMPKETIHQQQQQNEIYISLPQRLDIETHGLLIVATRKEFASYMGRLLEDKSKTGNDMSQGTTGCIQKIYKCLVQVSSIENRSSLMERLQRTNCMVVHYMNSQSTAPKIFVYVDDYVSRPSRPHEDEEEKDKWLKCVMRIMRVGRCCQLKNQDARLDGVNHDYAMELEIELLTGRTHQIRGQLAELGFPIVGDPLYGRKTHNSNTDSSSERSFSFSRNNADEMDPMALQCYSLSFLKPEWTKRKKKGRYKFLPSKELCSFTVDKAWWTDIYVPAESANDDSSSV